MKLMLVGRSARGKTTLLNKITEKGLTSCIPRWGEREQRPKAGGDTPVTVGIAVSNWTYSGHNTPRGRVKRITFKTWDFAGQVSIHMPLISLEAWIEPSNITKVNTGMLWAQLILFSTQPTLGECNIPYRTKV